MKNKINNKIWLMCILYIASFVPCDAKGKKENTPQHISGTVYDEFNRPLQGVMVKSEKGINSTITFLDGRYNIEVSDGSRNIIFSKNSYRDAKTEIDGKENIDIRLQDDVHRKDNLVQLGYYTQPRSEVTGAVASISGTDLEKTPSPTLSYAFEGRLAGVITKELNAELGVNGLQTYIRGTTSRENLNSIYIVDGVLCEGKSFEMITAQEIESITVLKDASLLALYGIQGASGVLVITTKRGHNGKLNVNVTFNQSFQQMSRTPYLPTAADYATLRNEAAKNDNTELPFTQYQIDKYKDGSDPILFPNVNYYDMMFKSFAQMQRASVNISGGNDKVKTFSSISMMNQVSQFKTDQSSFQPSMRQYDPTPHKLWFTYRSNLDIRFTNYFSGFIRLNGSIRREKIAGNTSANIYASLLHIPPTVYGPYAPLYTDPGNLSNTLGGQIIATDKETNPAYGQLNRSGFTNQTSSNTMVQTGLKLDLDSWARGLSLDGLFSYQMNARGELSTRSNYERGRRNNSNKFETFGTTINEPLSYAKNSFMDYYLIGNVKANYNRQFGKHHINAIGFAFLQNYIPESTNGLEYFDYNRINTGIMFSYNYDNKYLLKGDLGYSGSEQFARKKRFTATPSIAFGWIVSNEEFMSRQQWLSNLKLRASYGLSANDQLGGKRFLYADHIKKEGAPYMGSIPTRIMEYQRGNNELSAQQVRKLNVGVDLGLFNELSLSFDWFQDKTGSMLIGAGETYGIPEYLGIPLEYVALSNSGHLENKGLDMSFDYVKKFNKDFSLILSGNLLFNKNKIVDIKEAPLAEDYTYRYRLTGYPVGQAFGYLVDYSNGNGYFNTKEELKSLRYSFGTPRLGDLKYRDLDKNNVIDERDMSPIGYSNLPRFSYGISVGFKYKDLEFSCLFQGVNQITKYADLTEYKYDGIFSDIHKNAWTADRYTNGEKITYPALSLTSGTNNVNNNFFISDASYIRLKNATLSYSLPQKWIKALSMEQIKLTLTGHNLFTWDHMKTKNIDPEMSSIEAFQVYRIYNIGIQIIF